MCPQKNNAWALVFLYIQYLLSSEMKTEITIPLESNLVFTLKKCAIHKLSNNKRQKMAQGTCRIFSSFKSSDDSPYQKYDNYFLKVKEVVLLLSIIYDYAEIQYEETVSYLFEHSDGFIYAISFNNNCENLDKFKAQINRLSTVTNFGSDCMKPEFKQKIYEGRLNVETRPIWSQMRTTKNIGKNIGLGIGKISGFFKKSTNGAEKSIDEKKEQFSRNSVSDQTKYKWNSVTKKSEEVNETLTTVFKPIVTKCAGVVDDIGESFKTSQNKFVSTIRQYSWALRDSMNEAQKKGSKQQKKQEKLQEENESNNVIL